MQPLYLARIEDLGRGDLVQVDCAACHHVARCGRRSSCCGSGSARSPRCLISNRGSGAADAERGGGPSSRSSGTRSHPIMFGD